VTGSPAPDPEQVQLSAVPTGLQATPAGDDENDGQLTMLWTRRSYEGNIEQQRNLHCAENLQERGGGLGKQFDQENENSESEKAEHCAKGVDSIQAACLSAVEITLLDRHFSSFFSMSRKEYTAVGS
jgi:hypothetical protein